MDGLVRRVVAALISAWAAALAARQTRREFHALSDHMLRDIGVRRDQIDGVAQSFLRR